MLRVFLRPPGTCSIFPRASLRAFSHKSAFHSVRPGLIQHGDRIPFLFTNGVRRDAQKHSFITRITGGLQGPRVANMSTVGVAATTDGAINNTEHKEKKEEQKEEGKQGQQEWAGDRGVALWLFSVAGLVFGMVVIGGLTRLTKSGLSMVEWRLFGERPPTTPELWEEEFAKYKKHPEYIKLNQGMTLEEFQFIYFWEYGHRMLGRVVGGAFLFPFIYFASRGRLRQPLLKGKLTVIGCMILSQGLVGWWMVKSGLQQHPDDYNIPRVSPYRLAAHLLSAFAIYTGLFTVGMSVLPRGPGAAMATTPLVRLLSVGATVLVGVTVASGAFVAGNQAGLCYNEFPLMGGRFIPEDIVDPRLQPAWRNFFENSTLVQFDHRWLGTGTGLFIAGVYWATRALPLVHPARLPATLLCGMAGVQVALGITTLLTYVPVPLAAIHQSGALTLYTLSLWLLFVVIRGKAVNFRANPLLSAARGAASGGLNTKVPSAAFSTSARRYVSLRRSSFAATRRNISTTRDKHWHSSMTSYTPHDQHITRIATVGTSSRSMWKKSPSVSFNSLRVLQPSS